MSTARYIRQPLYVPAWQRCHRTMKTNGVVVVNAAPFSIGQVPKYITNGIQRDVYNNPDYLVQIAKGLNAGNPYRNVGATFKPGRVLVETFSKIGSGNTYETDTVRSSFLLDPWTFAQNGDDLGLRDQALKRLKTRISSRDKQMPMIAPIAELREFRDLVKSLTFLTVDMVKALLDIKRTKGKSAAQFASHVWLNWSFAVSPTLDDLVKLSELISDQLNNPGGQRFTERGLARKEWISSQNVNHSSSYFGNSIISVHCVHKLSYRYVAGFLCRVKSSNDYSAMSAYGAEVPALVPAVWELMAFSWLVDYFTTVGDYLEDVFISDQTQTVYCTCTKKYTCDMTFNVGPSRGSGILTSEVSGQPSTARFYDISRTNSSVIPNRSLRFKSVDEVAKSGVSKLLNLASILVGGKALSNRF